MYMDVVGDTRCKIRVCNALISSQCFLITEDIPQLSTVNDVDTFNKPTSLY